MIRRLNGLDLFSGIGGNTLGLREWVRTVAYCEQDKYAQSVLLSRMSDGSIEPAPIWDDVTTLKGAMLPTIDILIGGFPCQDISVAGRGAGLEGERSGLYFEVERLVQEIAPTFVFLENVPAIRTRGAERVAKGLAGLGYDCRWATVSAAEVGANHKRERWFLLAYARSSGLERDGIGAIGPTEEVSLSAGSGKVGNYLAHSASTQIGGQRDPELEGHREAESGTLIQGNRLTDSVDASECSDVSRPGVRIFDAKWWTFEPNVGRVANGVPSRVDRIRCLGNAVVPKQAREAFERLMGLR